MDVEVDASTPADAAMTDVGELPDAGSAETEPTEDAVPPPPSASRSLGPPTAAAPPAPLDPERPPALREAPTRMGTAWGDPDAPRPSFARPPAEVPDPDAPPRDHRYPRRQTMRPLTLDQGMLRFDSTIAVGGIGNVRATGFFGFAAGVLDDLELGATPVSVTFWPPISAGDPELYARVRAVSGPVQLAFRANVYIPVGPIDSQVGATAELAWTPDPVFRLDAALDYQAVIASPFHQRIGVPVSATLAAGDSNAFTLTTGVYVFNDADDVDVPILARWQVAYGGHQGPLGQFAMEGGLTDVTREGGPSWVVRAILTFYAYIGRGDGPASSRD